MLLVARRLLAAKDAKIGAISKRFLIFNFLILLRLFRLYYFSPRPHLALNPTGTHIMNAHALLTSQGWRGTGHSLHPTSDTTGLSRPLLVSQKQNVLGIGKKQHRTSDMWWQNAFDKSLKGLDTSMEGKVVQTITNGGSDMVAKGGGKYVGGGGLYACFVRGGVLGGTITSDGGEEKEREKATEPAGKKRKREGSGELVKGNKRDGEGETKEERRARKEKKWAKRAQIEKSGADQVKESEVEVEVEEVIVLGVETKEERKERRRQKKLMRQAAKDRAEASSEKATKKKRRKG